MLIDVYMLLCVLVIVSMLGSVFKLIDMYSVWVMLCLCMFLRMVGRWLVRFLKLMW